MNNKGQASNYLAGILALFMFAFVSIVSLLILTEVFSGFLAAGIYTGLAKIAGDKFLATLRLFDNITVFMLIALLIGIALTSFRLKTNTAYFIITLIMSTFTGLVAYVFNYVFLEMVSNSVFSGVMVYFPKTVILCTNFHWIALAFIVIGSIGLYAKKEAGDEAVIDIE